MEISFNCTKVNEALSPEQAYPELIEIPVGIKVTMGQEDWPV